MAAQRGISHINLLPKDSFEFSALGKILKWTTSVGRVLVVMTEFVVILAFASRFYFDKKLNDLTEELEGKTAIIKGYSEVESQARIVLAKQSALITSDSSNIKLATRIGEISRALPAGVLLKSINLETKEMVLEGTCGSEASFAQTLARLKTMSGVGKIGLGQTSFSQADGVLAFNIRVTYK